MLWETSDKMIPPPQDGSIHMFNDRMGSLPLDIFSQAKSK